MRLDPLGKESGGVGAIDRKLAQSHAFHQIVAFHQHGDDSDRPRLSLVERSVIDAENVGTHGCNYHTRLNCLSNSSRVKTSAVGRPWGQWWASSTR